MSRVDGGEADFSAHKRRLHAAEWIQVLAEGEDWIVSRQKGHICIEVPTERGMRGAILKSHGLASG